MENVNGSGSSGNNTPAYERRLSSEDVPNSSQEIPKEQEDDRERYYRLLEAKIAEAEAAGKEPFSAEEFDRYYTRFDLSDSSTKTV